MATNFVGFAILRGPDQQTFTYIFAVLWGLFIGWYYAADTLLFALVLPSGNESEFAGFNQYVSKIVAWLPPLVFGLMFDNGINMSYAGMHLNVYLLLAGVCYWMMDDWQECLENAKRPNKIGWAMGYQ